MVTSAICALLSFFCKVANSYTKNRNGKLRVEFHSNSGLPTQKNSGLLTQKLLAASNGELYTAM